MSPQNISPQNRSLKITRLAARLAVMLLILAGCFSPALAPSALAVPVQQLVTPGGIAFWYVRDDSLPMIRLQMAWRGGAAAATPGAAQFLASLLDEGAGEMTALTFQNRLADIGADLSFSADRDALTGSLRVLTQHGDAGFALLSQAVTTPRFDADAVERIRRQLRAGQKKAAARPGQIASDAWWADAFKIHPYANPVRGTAESVAAISKDELHALHAKMLARDNLVLAIVANLPPRRMMQLVDDSFTRLPEKTALPPVPEADILPMPQTKLIPFPGPQTEIVFGHAGLGYTDADFYPAYVLNYILGGGGFASRLTEEIREKRGLAYGVYSYLYPLTAGSVWLGGVASSNATAAQAATLVRQTIADILQNGVTESELANAKNYLTGAYALRFDSGQKIAGQMLAAQRNGFPADYFIRRNDLIHAVSRADVERAAKKLLKPEQLRMIAVGAPENWPQ